MTWEQTAILALGAVLELVALAMAFSLGHRDGYWSRVDEEKTARLDK